MSTPKEVRKLISLAEEQGWRVELKKGGHYRLYSPDGKTIVTAGSTPSDRRAYQNIKSDLKRGGLKLDGFEGGSLMQRALPRWS